MLCFFCYLYTIIPRSYHQYILFFEPSLSLRKIAPVSVSERTVAPATNNPNDSAAVDQQTTHCCAGSPMKYLSQIGEDFHPSPVGDHGGTPALQPLLRLLPLPKPLHSPSLPASNGQFSLSANCTPCPCCGGAVALDVRRRPSTLFFSSTSQDLLQPGHLRRSVLPIPRLTAHLATCCALLCPSPSSRRRRGVPISSTIRRGARLLLRPLPQPPPSPLRSFIGRHHCATWTHVAALRNSCCHSSS